MLLSQQELSQMLLRRTFSRAWALIVLLAASASMAQAAEVVRLGVTAGPHAQIAEIARKVAARDGLDIKIVEFQDYIQPNAALDAGELDANSYQHLPFLESQIKARGYRISAVGYTVTFPMGFYSKRYKSLADLPRGAKVGIQNDPSNSGRALHPAAEGRRRHVEAGHRPAAPRSVDIADNPKQLADRAARCGAVAALARRPRRQLDQHGLRDARPASCPRATRSRSRTRSRRTRTCWRCERPTRTSPGSPSW